jgi:PAS domain S-box-containing protein
MKKDAPPPPLEDAAAARDAFVQAVAPSSGFHVLFDHLPGVSFFAKDRQCRIMAANRHFFERFGFENEQALLGKNDFDLFPARLAENFRRDDQEVMSRAEPKLNIVELFFNRQGIPDWFITHKLPVTDRNGRVIGVMGTTRSYTEAKEVLQPYLAIDRAVACIRERFREKITVRQLASHVHLSERQLHRKFLEAFGSSPQAFILKVRVQAACDQLQQDDRPLSDVAYETGFADQSSFTQHFRRHMGMTPLKFRRQFRLVQPQEGGKQG